ncbi:MAG: protein kinase [Planctomycetaceae bacterium]
MAVREEVQKLFHDDSKVRVVIWGEGGTGKSALAVQIAQWAMGSSPSDRLIGERPILPIVLDRFVGMDLLAAIVGKLEALVELDGIPPDFAELLLRNKSILLIVEDFSEWSEDRRQLIKPDASDFPSNLLVVTSRWNEDLNSTLSLRTIQPQLVDADTIERFLTTYFAILGFPELLQQDDVREQVDVFSAVLREQGAAPQIIRLFADKLVEWHQGHDNVPTASFIGLVKQHLIYLNRNRTENEPDHSVVYQDCQLIAWLCFAERLTPSAVPLSQVILQMEQVAAPQSPRERFRYLESELQLISKDDLEEEVTFRNWVLAEYLAAVHLLNRRRTNSEEWQSFLERPGNVESFSRVLAHCCFDGRYANQQVIDELHRAGILSTGQPPQAVGRYRVVSGWDGPLIKLANGLQYRVCELQHVNIPAKRARGKFYDLNGLPTEARSRVVQRVKRHANVLAQLEDVPNVHQFVDYLEEKGNALWVIEEWIDGRPLSEFVRTQKSRSVPDCLLIMKDVALGLRALHERQFYMRTLDPDSIYVESGGTVLLTNFELTKAVGNSISVSTGSALEGLAYTAPQLRGGERDGYQVGDVYSWGAVFTFVLTGTPWDDTNAASRLAELRKFDFSPKLKKCIESCVSPTEKDRPQSMADVLACF